MLLFLIGLVGLRAGYAQRSGPVGGALLWLAILGSAVSLLGAVGMVGYRMQAEAGTLQTAPPTRPGLGELPHPVD
jgi:hypothetical protein